MIWKYLHKVSHRVSWIDHKIVPEIRAMISAMMSRSPKGGIEARYEEVVLAVAKEGGLVCPTCDGDKVELTSQGEWDCEACGGTGEVSLENNREAALSVAEEALTHYPLPPKVMEFFQKNVAQYGHSSPMELVGEPCVFVEHISCWMAYLTFDNPLVRGQEMSTRAIWRKDWPMAMDAAEDLAARSQFGGDVMAMHELGLQIAAAEMEAWKIEQAAVCPRCDGSAVLLQWSATEEQKIHPDGMLEVGKIGIKTQKHQCSACKGTGKKYPDYDPQGSFRFSFDRARWALPGTIETGVAHCADLRTMARVIKVMEDYARASEHKTAFDLVQEMKEAYRQALPGMAGMGLREAVYEQDKKYPPTFHIESKPTKITAEDLESYPPEQGELPEKIRHLELRSNPIEPVLGRVGVIGTKSVVVDRLRPDMKCTLCDNGVGLWGGGIVPTGYGLGAPSIGLTVYRVVPNPEYPTYWDDDARETPREDDPLWDIPTQLIISGKVIGWEKDKYKIPGSGIVTVETARGVEEWDTRTTSIGRDCDACEGGKGPFLEAKMPLSRGSKHSESKTDPSSVELLHQMSKDLYEAQVEFVNEKMREAMTHTIGEKRIDNSDINELLDRATQQTRLSAIPGHLRIDHPAEDSRDVHLVVHQTKSSVELEQAHVSVRTNRKSYADPFFNQYAQVDVAIRCSWGTARDWHRHRTMQPFVIRVVRKTLVSPEYGKSPYESIQIDQHYQPISEFGKANVERYLKLCSDLHDRYISEGNLWMAMLCLPLGTRVLMHGQGGLRDTIYSFGLRKWTQGSHFEYRDQATQVIEKIRQHTDRLGISGILAMDEEAQ